MNHDLMNVKLVLGHGGEMAVSLDVTSSKIVDPQDGTLEISLTNEAMSDYCLELGIDAGGSDD